MKNTWFCHEEGLIPTLQKWDTYPSILFIGVSNPPRKPETTELNIDVISYLNSKILRDFFGKEKMDEFMKYIREEKEEITKRYSKLGGKK